MKDPWRNRYKIHEEISTGMEKKTRMTREKIGARQAGSPVYEKEKRPALSEFLKKQVSF